MDFVNVSPNKYINPDFNTGFKQNQCNSRQFGTTAIRNIDPRIFGQKHSKIIDSTGIF